MFIVRRRAFIIKNWLWLVVELISGYYRHLKLNGDRREPRIKERGGLVLKVR